MLFSLILWASTQAMAHEGLLRLLNPGLTDAPVACETAAYMVVGQSTGTCAQELCESHLQTQPSDAQMIDEIRATKDPRNGELLQATDQAIDRVLAARTKLNALAARPAQDLVRATFSQGAASTSKFLRGLSGAILRGYPLMREAGGVDFVFSNELRANKNALKAAQEIAKKLRPQLEQDMLGRMAREAGYYPVGALNHMRQYYGDKLKASPTEAERKELTVLMAALAGPDSEETLGRMMSLVGDGNIGFPEVTLQCADCEKQLVTLVQFQIDQMKAPSSEVPPLPEQKLNKLEMLSALCKAGHWALKGMAPTKDERANFETTRVQVLSGYFQKIYPKFSKESYQQLNAMDVTVAATLEADDEIVPKLNDVKRALNPAPTGNDAGELFELSSALENVGEQIMCKVDYAAPSDHFHPVLGTINISPWVMKRADSTVLAHEIGHRMADFFVRGHVSAHSRGVFEKIRGCLTIPAGGKYDGGLFSVDGLRTEEDTADFFAQLAVGGLSASMCRLAANPMGLLMGKTIADELIPDFEDTHSPSLWRAIHGLVMNGESVPTSCQQAMAEKNIPAPKDCRPQFK